MINVALWDQPSQKTMKVFSRAVQLKVRTTARQYIFIALFIIELALKKLLENDTRELVCRISRVTILLIGLCWIT